MTEISSTPPAAGMPAHHEHVVQLYDDETFLVDAATGYVSAGLLRGEIGIVVATPRRRAAIDASLRAAGVEVDQLQRTGQLVIHDAATLLGAIMLERLPDAARFHETVGFLVAEATRDDTRRVRMFSELVDLLAADGNMVGALRLEELWAELRADHPFALFCSYSLERFAGSAGTSPLESVCARHDRVLPTERYSRLESPDAQLRTIAILQQQAQALSAEVQARRRSDDRLRRQFLANPLPTFVWERTAGAGPDGSDDYVLVEQNEAAARFLRSAGEDAAGVHLSQLLPDGPMGALPDLLACADPDRRVWREHSFTVRGTGQQRYIQLSLVALPPDLAVTFVEDVTDRLAEDQRKAQQARAEKLQALGQLASGVAHDLNQHLTMIAGCGELVRDALDHEGVSPEVLAALDGILRAALDGGETVSQLLRFGRHQPDGAPGSVEVAALLQDVSRLTAPRWRDLAQLEGRPIRLDVRVMGVIADVLGHGPSLREALTHLVFNAVDALPCGGEIHLTAEPVGDRVAVTVTDFGVSMVQSVGAPGFGGMFSTAGAEARSLHGTHGSSLALTQVWSIVERQGGTVEVLAAEQDGVPGTAVRLTLPAAPPARTTASRTIPTGNGPRLRLLVVDDEPALAQLAAQGLRRVGHQVVTLHSAAEALSALDLDHFDVLVTDLGLGEGMNGWELVSLARQQRPNMRVVMVSGWASDIEPSLAAANGVDAVVAKPYQLARLIQAVEGAPIQDGADTRQAAS